MLACVEAFKTSVLLTTSPKLGGAPLNPYQIHTYTLILNVGTNSKIPRSVLLCSCCVRMPCSISTGSVSRVQCTDWLLVFEISHHLFRVLSLLKALHPSFPPKRAPLPGGPSFCVFLKKRRVSSPKPPLEPSSGLERLQHNPWTTLLCSSLR